ncbi:hypothetical protein X801_01683 [Opisthorchis viverrini]|uniref:Uncharacterized protein n=1 Tax=Opisthorchis viverrini TaxID=6198 RepID=A0A1S8X6T3_OPIVI|nr:hypothetical protein X801_01683 [Opisthorchis viverrini]
MFVPQIYSFPKIKLLLGVFARVNAVALSEDIPLDEAAWIKDGYPGQALDEAYVMMSNNCFIAAGIYGVIVVLAGVQFYFAKRKDRLSR